MPVFGIDTSKPGEYVMSRATKDCRNGSVLKNVITKRPGLQTAGLTLGERIQHMVELQKGNGTTYFVRIGPTKFEELNKTTLAWTSRANAPLTATDADQVSSALPLLTGNRILVYTNGVDNIRKYIGGVNDADLGGSPPKAKYVFHYADYLIALNITSGGNRFPWRIQWADTGDPETWVGGNSGTKELLEDSDDISGAGIYGTKFTVHKENAIYVGQLTNTSGVFYLERRETGAGTVANATVISLPSGEQIFLARDGFRLFNGISAPLIDAYINDELRELLNPQYAYKSWGKIIRELDEVHIGVPIGSDTEPSTVYKFNYVTRQVFRDDRPNVSFFSQYLNTVGQVSWDDVPDSWDSRTEKWDSVALAALNPVYIFGYSDGTVKKRNTSSSDDGDAIEFKWDSKDFTSLDYPEIGEAGLLMRWMEVGLWMKGSGSASVYVSYDGGTTYSLAGSVDLASDYPSDFSPLVVYIDQISTRCSIRIVHDTNYETCYLKNFSLGAVKREESR